MTPGKLDRKMETVQRRLQNLLQTQGAAADAPLVAKLLKELAEALEELRVAGEELQAQNEELGATRVAVEGERQRYQELFEWAPDAYLVTDRYGRILDANGAATELFGIPSRFLPGTVLPAYVAEHDRAEFRAHLRDAISGVLRQEWRTGIVDRQGRRQPVDIRVAAVHDKRGEVRHVRWLAPVS